MKSSRYFALFTIICLAYGCENRYGQTDSSDTLQDISPADTGSTQADILFWDRKEPPLPETSLLKNLLKELNISIWHTRAEGINRPTGGELGSFGIGNGLVFGFVGLTYPLNTLHSLCGPYYEKKDRFFGDFAIEFYQDNNKVEFANEYVLRSLSGPFNIIIGSDGNILAEILDFTPLPANGDDILRRNYIRIISVKNTGKSAADYSLFLKTANYQKFENNLLIEEKENEVLSTFFIKSDEKTNIVYENSRYGIILSGINKDEERVVILIHHISDKGADILAETQYIENYTDIDKLIFETIKNYSDWNSNTLKIKTPDRAVNNLIEGLKLTLITQIGKNGAAAPMSEYTRVWTRDLTGWVFGLLSVGAFDDVKKILQYLHYAIIKGGDIRNSYPADLNTDEEVTEPDWENMPPLTDKASAEGPSHIPIYHHLYYEYTGDKSLFERHRRLIKRALVAQNISKDGLIPFSGDETYRAAMNAAFGLPLEYAHHENSYSPNSGILFIRAAKGIIPLFESSDSIGDSLAIREKLQLVENAFYKYFILPDGCISAFITISTNSPFQSPFEDESLIMSFLKNGYFDSDVAYNNIACLLGRIHIDKGVLLSQIDEKYRDFLGIRVRKGILTGMLPGYTLAALTENSHPEAEDAFNQMGRYADTSGNFGEYLIYDNRDTLSLIYDAGGKQGDYTARFRPWEGGINLYAILNYLLGLEIQREKSLITIRPHLPNNWNFIGAENIKTGDNIFALNITRNETEYLLTLKSSKDSDQRIRIIIDFPDGYIFSAGANTKFTLQSGRFGINSAILELDGLKSGTTEIRYRIIKPEL